jgi:hypothetical protein
MNFLFYVPVCYDVANHLQTETPSQILSLNFDPKARISMEQTFISRAFESVQCFIFTYNLFVVGAQVFREFYPSIRDFLATTNSL